MKFANVLLLTKCHRSIGHSRSAFYSRSWYSSRMNSVHALVQDAVCVTRRVTTGEPAPTLFRLKQLSKRLRLSMQQLYIRVVDLLAHQQRASAMTHEARAGHRVGNQESQQQRRGAMSPEAYGHVEADSHVCHEISCVCKHLCSLGCVHT